MTLWLPGQLITPPAKRWKLVYILLIMGVGGFVIACGTVHSLFRNSIDNLPAGDCIGSYDSPDKFYTVKAYLCNGGATVDFAVRSEVTYNKVWYRLPRNIYWQYHCRDATVA
jgi:Family of unknown function (DUF5412)